MASFAAQVQQARASARAAFSVEAANRQLVSDLFDKWDRGQITTRQMRFRLEAVVRSAYRASGELGRDLARRQSGIPGWRPADVTRQTDYLSSLQADARAALTEYIKTRARKTLSPEQQAKARARAVMRTQHSAGVATTRGYTDALIAAFSELEEKGVQVRKVWTANFVNNDPCPRCRALHSQKTTIHGTFRDIDGKGIYRDLKGPPRHPRCKCFLIIVVVTLDNAGEILDVDSPSDSTSMTANDVRDLPTPVYHSVLKALGLVAAGGSRVR